MANTTFDTLSAAQKLKAAGVASAQAEAIAEAEAARAARSDLATKVDLYRVALWQCLFVTAIAGLAVGLNQMLSS